MPELRRQRVSNRHTTPYTGFVADPFSLEDFLAQQRADYRASLPARLQQLETASAGGAWHDVERCAHGIAGSAATFGLAALGDAARELEEAIEGLAGAEPQAPGREALQRQVQSLAAMLREAIAAG